MRYALRKHAKILSFLGGKGREGKERGGRGRRGEGKGMEGREREGRDAICDMR